MASRRRGRRCCRDERDTAQPAEPGGAGAGAGAGAGWPGAAGCPGTVVGWWGGRGGGRRGPAGRQIQGPHVAAHRQRGRGRTHPGAAQPEGGAAPGVGGTRAATGERAADRQRRRQPGAAAQVDLARVGHVRLGHRDRDRRRAAEDPAATGPVDVDAAPGGGGDLEGEVVSLTVRHEGDLGAELRQDRCLPGPHPVAAAERVGEPERAAGVGGQVDRTHLVAHEALDVHGRVGDGAGGADHGAGQRGGTPRHRDRWWRHVVVHARGAPPRARREPGRRAARCCSAVAWPAAGHGPPGRRRGSGCLRSGGPTGTRRGRSRASRTRRDR